MMPIRDGIHLRSCTFEIVYIRYCVHSGWCPFGMVSIRGGTHSRWCPFEMVPIRDGVHLSLCPFGIVSIWDCAHSGLSHLRWCPFRHLSGCPCKYMTDTIVLQSLSTAIVGFTCTGTLSSYTLGLVTDKRTCCLPKTFLTMLLKLVIDILNIYIHLRS